MADAQKPAPGRRFGASAVCTLLVVPVLAAVASAVYLSARYHPPPSDFGTGSMFDQIATRYDLINRALALNLDTGWRVQMVRAVTEDGELFRRQGRSGEGGARVLDLATGTADVAILIAKEAERADAADAGGGGGAYSVLGVDPSQNMIDVGRAKVSARNLADTVTLRIGDARRLDGLGDGTFDAATMAFGIRNVPERDVALCEIWRVLKKESGGGSSGGGAAADVGRLAILEFSEPGPDAGAMGSLARLFIRHVVPVVGAALSGAPREYLHLQNSIKEFPSPEEFGRIMEGLKCGGTGGGQEGGTGAFRVEEIRQMNFGSVQLYIATPYMRGEA